MRVNSFLVQELLPQALGMHLERLLVGSFLVMDEQIAKMSWNLPSCVSAPECLVSNSNVLWISALGIPGDVQRVRSNVTLLLPELLHSKTIVFGP